MASPKSPQPPGDGGLDDNALRLMANAAVQRRVREGTWQGGVRPHIEYQTRPVAWMVEKLGIPENTIRWSQNPEYQHCTCDTSVCNADTRAGGPHVWDGDVDPLAIALDLMFQGKSVAISSGTSLSKTYTLAAAATLCFLAVFEHSNVFSIAPKYDLLLKNMWKEVGKLLPRFKKHFPNADLLTGTLRMLKGEGEQEIWTASAFGAGLDANEEVSQRLKGFHAAKMLWIMEELPGVEQPLIDTIIKTSSGEFNPILGMGQPKDKFDTLSAFGNRPWVTKIRMSAYDFPNVVANREIVPGGRSRTSVARDLADADGDENNPLFLSQVRGIAPSQSTMALIKREWCEQAAARYNDPVFRVGPLSLGCDPSNSEHHGRSALSRWQGACCTDVEQRVCKDASVFGKEIYEEAVVEGSDPVRYLIDPWNIGVDAIGVGASTVNKCRELGLYVRALYGAGKPELRIDEDLRYQPLVVGSDPENPTGPVVLPEERYANLRSQMAWVLREDLRLGRIALPNDPELFDEICMMVWDRPGGKITVGSKDDIIEKLKRSPDRADSVIYGNFARKRRPMPKSDEDKPDPRQYDTAFAEMMESRSIETGAAQGRRPF